MQKKGFSLLEILITIAIVGILASMALPSYTRYIAKTKIVNAIDLLSRANRDLQITYNDTGVWPTSAVVGGTKVTRPEHVERPGEEVALIHYNILTSSTGGEYAFLCAYIKGLDLPNVDPTKEYKKDDIPQRSRICTGLNYDMATDKMTLYCGQFHDNDPFAIDYGYVPTNCRCIIHDFDCDTVPTIP